MIGKHCKDMSKKEIVDTACKVLGLHSGLSKFKKDELVDLCCDPEGPRRYIENAWKEGHVDARDDSLVGDILLGLPKDDVITLLRENPGAPSKAFWKTLEETFKITRGNLFGNPVKCDIPVPGKVRGITLLATRGGDVFDHKDEIKNELGGVYFPQLRSAWTWNINACNDLASTFERNEILMGDVTIEPCTVYVFPFNDVTRHATRFLDPEPMRGMFAIKKERTVEEARERVEGYKEELSNRFGIPASDINEDAIKKLVSDPETTKYFHEEFGTFPSWSCADPERVIEMLEEGKAKIIDRENVPFDEVDVSPRYLQKQRDVLPKVAFKVETSE